MSDRLRQPPFGGRGRCLSGLGSVSLPSQVVSDRIDKPQQSDRKANMQRGQGLYPEIYLKVAASTKFPIANLEGDGHLVGFVEDLVKAFSGVGGKLDVVCQGCEREEGKEAGGKEGEEAHDEGRWRLIEMDNGSAGRCRLPFNHQRRCRRR